MIHLGKGIIVHSRRHAAVKIMLAQMQRRKIDDMIFPRDIRMQPHPPYHQRLRARLESFKRFAQRRITVYLAAGRIFGKKRRYGIVSAHAVHIDRRRLHIPFVSTAPFLICGLLLGAFSRISL